MKKLLISLLLALAGLLHAAPPAFLELTINGNPVAGDPSLTQGFPGVPSSAIRVLGFRHELIRVGSGVTHKGFTIVKPLDKATPLLAQALGQNGVGTAVIRMYKIDSTEGISVNFLTYTLINCQITRVQPWMANIEDAAAINQPAMEEITFTYQSIEIVGATGPTVTLPVAR